MIPAKLKVIRETLAFREDLLLAYHLGEAHQRGVKNEDSLDLGLLFLPTLSAEKCEDARLAVIELLAVSLNTTGVRAILLNNSSPNISYSAINRGALLYCLNEEERLTFENDVRTEFQRSVYQSSSDAWRARSG